LLYKLSEDLKYIKIVSFMSILRISGPYSVRFISISSLKRIEAIKLTPRSITIIGVILISTQTPPSYLFGCVKTHKK